MFGLLVVGFGTIYATVQQAQRSDADYPQIQIAEDTAAALNKGELPATLIGAKVDIDKSLTPFIIIYDKKGRVVLGSGYLYGKVPKAPIGILEASQGQDYHSVTWEPDNDVRIAAVISPAKDYYVLSGRNLKEVEKNEDRTLQLALLGGIIATGLLGVVFILSELLIDDYS